MNDMLLGFAKIAHNLVKTSKTDCNESIEPYGPPLFAYFVMHGQQTVEKAKSGSPKFLEEFSMHPPAGNNKPGRLPDIQLNESEQQIGSARHVEKNTVETGTIFPVRKTAAYSAVQMYKTTSVQEEQILLDSAISFVWDTTINDWVYSQSKMNTTLPTYLTSIIFYWFYYYRDAPLFPAKIMISCDANGNQRIYADYHWNTITNEWVKFKKLVNAYDGNGNVTTRAYYHSDTITN